MLRIDDDLAYIENRMSRSTSAYTVPGQKYLHTSLSYVHLILNGSIHEDLKSETVSDTTNRVSNSKSSHSN